MIRRWLRRIVASDLVDEVQRLGWQRDRAHEANVRAAERIAHLTIEVEGLRAQVAARDVMLDSLEGRVGA